MLFSDRKTPFPISTLDVQRMSGLDPIDSYPYPVLSSMHGIPEGGSFSLILNGEDGLMSDIKDWQLMMVTCASITIYIALHKEASYPGFDAVDMNTSDNILDGGG